MIPICYQIPKLSDSLVAVAILPFGCQVKCDLLIKTFQMTNHNTSICLVTLSTSVENLELSKNF